MTHQTQRERLRHRIELTLADKLIERNTMYENPVDRVDNRVDTLVAVLSELLADIVCNMPHCDDGPIEWLVNEADDNARSAS